MKESASWAGWYVNPKQILLEPPASASTREPRMRAPRVPGYPLTGLEVLIEAVHYGCQVDVKARPDPQGMESGIGGPGSFR